MSVLVVLDRGERRRLLALRDDERVAARDETRHDASLLRRGRGRERLDARLLRPRGARLPARLGDAVARRPDLRRDALVLPADPGEQLEVVEDVGERRRAERRTRARRGRRSCRGRERARSSRESAMRYSPRSRSRRAVCVAIVRSRFASRSRACESRPSSTESRACWASTPAWSSRTRPATALSSSVRTPACWSAAAARSAKLADLAVDARLLGSRIARRAPRGAERRGEHRGDDGGHEAGATTHHRALRLHSRRPCLEPVERPERLGGLPPERADDAR